MGFYQAFGVGRLSIDGEKRAVADYIIRNGKFDDTSKLKGDLRTYPTLPAEISKRYDKIGLLFSREVGCGGVGDITAVFLDKAHRIAACSAQDASGVEHFYLGQLARRDLATDSVSVVRDYGEWCGVVLDTRRSDFPLGKQRIEKSEMDANGFRQDVRDYDGLSSDFIAPIDSLSHMWQDNYSFDLVGTTSETTPFWAYFAKLGSIAASGPFHDGIVWTRVVVSGKTVLACQDLAVGKQMYLTSEGFDHLRAHHLAVFRAKRKTNETPWERLETLWTPEGLDI